MKGEGSNMMGNEAAYGLGNAVQEGQYNGMEEGQYSVNRTKYNVNRVHGCPPNQNYGIGQKCQPAYSLPVYYEEPM